MRIAIWSFLCFFFALQCFLQVLFWRFVSSRMWLFSAIEAIAFVSLSVEFRKRRSLRWRARHMLHTLREPGVFDVSSWFEVIARFKRFTSLLLLWFICALFVSPFYGSLSPSLGYFKAAFDGAKSDFFMGLWQVHATVLGVFLVLLTFVFQFISLRSAYETSLLPFLARRVHLAAIITINFLFVALEMFPGFLGTGSTAQPIFRYFAVVGFIFSVLSACFLLFRILELLKPEMLEIGLSDLVKSDLIKEFEEEQFLSLASGILEEQCSSHGLEFSELDLFNDMPAIRSQKVGTIVDVDLNRLARFSKRLIGTLPLRSPVRRALIFGMIGEELTRTHNVLGRVSIVDLGPDNERFLGKCFKVKES